MPTGSTAELIERAEKVGDGTITRVYISDDKKKFGPILRLPPNHAVFLEKLFFGSSLHTCLLQGIKTEATALIKNWFVPIDTFCLKLQLDDQTLF